ncbi:hypothetical protein HWV62_10979 [Athelia sp. TMB]|nr:hypothetical protein HWV62_10979 [Athelia sp. TMB]
MSFCTIPACSLDLRRLPNQSSTPAAIGDIMSEYVSALDPIDKIIKDHEQHSRSNKPTSEVGSSMKSGSAKSWRPSQKSEGTRKGSRPVIVLQDDKVCFMGTFEGRDPETLPDLLRRFLIPVCTTKRDEQHPPHLHTTPTWQVDSDRPAWVLACPTPKGSLLLRKRWKTVHGEQLTHYTVDSENLIALDVAADEAREKFDAEDPAIQEKEIVEFKHWKSKDERRESSGNATSPEDDVVHPSGAAVSSRQT